MINKSLSLGLLSGLTFALAAPALARRGISLNEVAEYKPVRGFSQP
jgi:hypothetical protein